MRIAGILCTTTLLTAALASGGCDPAPSGAGGPAAPPPAVDQRSGVLFLGDTPVHTCSGAVLATPAADLVLTAAHCVVGPGLATSFAPGYHDGISPFGVHDVTQVYLDPRWLQNQDPRADYAVLRVRQPFTTPGLTLSTSPEPGRTVTVTGYSAGADDSPISCTAATTRTDTDYPTVTCSGLGAGTSGGPWVSGENVVGLTGGLHQGGCPPDPTDYSPPFDDHTAELVRRATDNAPADTAPVAFADGC